MKTSPSEPTDSPSWYSSVFASYHRAHTEIEANPVKTSLSHFDERPEGRMKGKAHLYVHVVVSGYHVALVLHSPL